MLFESANSDQEEKQRDLPNGNGMINLKNLITNVDTFLVCKECAHERALQIELEQGKYQENFVAFVEAYFQLTLSDEHKGIRELHQDFKKQKSRCQKFSHQDLF